jgi:hypothetical protein
MTAPPIESSPEYHEWRTARLLLACLVGLAKKIQDEQKQPPGVARRMALDRIVEEWTSRSPTGSKAEAESALFRAIELASQPEPVPGSGQHVPQASS